MTEKVYRTQSVKITLSLSNYQIDISNLPNGQIEIKTTEIIDGYSDIENAIIIPIEMIDYVVESLQDIQG